MDALGELLDSVLSDPEKMSQIAAVAEGLGLAPQTDAPEQEASELRDLLPAVLHLAEQTKQDPKQAQLFAALRPFLRPERRRALDRAAKAARLSALAAMAMRTLQQAPAEQDEE